MTTFGRKVYGKDRHRMQFAPMVDCVFLLLIFFLVAAQVRPREGDFNAEVSGHRGPGEPFRGNLINVWVAEPAQGHVDIRLGGSTGRLLTDFDALTQALLGMKGENSLVVIDGPAEVSIQTVTQALDAVARAAMPAMTITVPER